MLVELGVVEQRYAAVREVLKGATVVDVARRSGVARQTVHEWLRKYATGGMAALVDRSSKPARCAHQMAPAVEARVVELRRAHPGWGPRTILHRLASEDVDPLPGRSSVHRALVRHGLIEPGKRRRKREDYKRWERSRSMELWQMDVVGRIHLADGTEVSAITGIDDHSRFCVCARLVARATARPVCDALAWAMRHPRGAGPDPHRQRQGVHRPLRKGPRAGAVRPRLRRQRHPAPADGAVLAHDHGQGGAVPQDPASRVVCAPTTALSPPWPRPRRHWMRGSSSTTPNGRTSRAGTAGRWSGPAGRWTRHPRSRRDARGGTDASAEGRPVRPAGVVRWVDQHGQISVAGFAYKAGRVFAGEPVEVICEAGLVELVYTASSLIVVVAPATPGRKRMPTEASAPTRL